MGFMPISSYISLSIGVLILYEGHFILSPLSFENFAFSRKIQSQILVYDKFKREGDLLSTVLFFY